MNSKITFPRLASLLADKSGRSKRFSEDFLREFFSLISEQLEAGASVKIKGLGTFRLLRVEPRKSVDVTTGLPMEISGHSKVTFTPAKELAEAVNAPFEAFSTIEIGDDVDISDITDEFEIQTIQENPVESLAEESISEEPTQPTEIKEEIISEEPIMPAEPKEEIISEEPTITAEPKAQIISEETTIPAETKWGIISEESILSVESQEDKPSEALKNRKEPILPTQEEIIPEEPKENFTPLNTSTDYDDEFVIINETPESGSQFQNNWNNDIVNEDAGRYKHNTWKTVFILVGCALIAVIFSFAIWCFLTKPETDENMGNMEYAVVSSDMESLKTDESVMVEDTLPAPVETESVSEDPVPTAVSDEVTYDTIGTTRYLTTMAKAHYGSNKFWPYIYEENKDHIGHPDKIRPGTPIRIPKLSKFGVSPTDPADVEKANRLAVEIYARYGKKI